MGARTGGRTPQGQIERARLPSVAKDLWHAYFTFAPALASGDPSKVARAGLWWAYEKGNPAVKFGHEFITQRDDMGNELPSGWHRLMQAAWDSIKPISVQNQPKTGTNLNNIDRYLGIGALGQAYTNPKALAAAQAKHEAQVRMDTARRELTRQKQLQTPDYATIKSLETEMADAKRENSSLRLHFPSPPSATSGGPGSRGGSSGARLGRESGFSGAAGSSGSRGGGGGTRAAAAPTDSGATVLRGGGSDTPAADTGGGTTGGGGVTRAGRTARARGGRLNRSGGRGYRRIRAGT